MLHPQLLIAVTYRTIDHPCKQSPNASQGDVGTLNMQGEDPKGKGVLECHMGAGGEGHKDRVRWAGQLDEIWLV